MSTVCGVRNAKDYDHLIEPVVSHLGDRPDGGLIVGACWQDRLREISFSLAATGCYGEATQIDLSTLHSSDVGNRHSLMLRKP